MIVLFVTGLETTKGKNTMKKISKLLVGVFCALLLATSAFAADTAVKASTNAPVAVSTVAAPTYTFLAGQAPVADPQWVFAIGGSGATGLQSDSETAFGLNFQIGRTAQLLLPFEYGLRQGIGYASEGEDTTLLTTKAYADWTLAKLGPVDVFAGGNVGLTYGNTVPVWTAAPEIGADVWLTKSKNMAIEGRVEFPFDLNDGAKFNEAMTYTVGLKVRF